MRGLEGMISPRQVVGVLRTDGLRLIRDQFLLGMAALIVGMCVALRLGIPWIADQLMQRWSFDLEPYFVLLAGHVSVVLPTVTVAILGGFILLETREQRVAQALRVSPLPMRFYFALLAAVMVAIGVFFALVHAAIIGLALPPVSALLWIAACSGCATPAQALFLAGASKNKVEAMAYGKVVSGMAPIALVAFFLAEPWQWLAGFYPGYWAAKAYWLAYAGDAAWPLWALGAPVTGALWWLVLWRVFGRSFGR